MIVWCLICAAVNALLCIGALLSGWHYFYVIVLGLLTMHWMLQAVIAYERTRGKTGSPGLVQSFEGWVDYRTNEKGQIEIVMHPAPDDPMSRDAGERIPVFYGKKHVRVTLDGRSNAQHSRAGSHEWPPGGYKGIHINPPPAGPPPIAVRPSNYRSH